MHTGFGGENVGMKSFGCSRLRRGDAMEKNLKGIGWRGVDSIRLALDTEKLRAVMGRW
jgi:hypothetical protein